MKVFCNPLNLSYRYQIHKGSSGIYACREAADPSVVLFRGRYYLFASMSLCAWGSDDLVTWEEISLPGDLPLMDYAPDVCVRDGWLWFCASRGGAPILHYRTRDVEKGPYECVPGTYEGVDPNRFVDEDGRVYFYWGCSDRTPIWGMELNPETMLPVSEPVPLIEGHPDVIGYERSPGLPGRKPYIEGAWMTKHDGRYYLQYATPGTQFATYADGVYVSDAPLGPFRLAENNPYSFYPSGFFPGAGHGSTLTDPEGAVWHFATMRLSVRHMFERRVGLYPAGFDRDGELFCNQRYADWPQDVERLREDPFAKPLWMPQHLGASVRASSHTPGHEAELAVSEDVQTFWEAGTADPGEYLLLDLGEWVCLHAVQINFADGKPDISRFEGKVKGDRLIDPGPQRTAYLLEGSRDGTDWFVLADRTRTQTDCPHDFCVFEEGIDLRYVRLSRMELPYSQKPCVSGLRLFGIGSGEVPEEPTFEVRRTGDTELTVRVEKQEDALGWNMLFGHAPDKLYHSCLIFSHGETWLDALVKGQDCYVRLDAFNRAGIREGSRIIKL